MMRDNCDIIRVYEILPRYVARSNLKFEIRKPMGELSLWTKLGYPGVEICNI